MSDSSTANSSSNRMLMIVLGIVGALFIGLIGFRWLTGRVAAQPATISGVINFNGLKPKEQPNAAAVIKLMQREQGSTATFTDTGVTIPVADLGTWNWSTSESGITYELRADAYYGSQFIKSSSVAIVTAPATDVMLTFNVTMQDIPENLRPSPVPSAPTSSPQPNTSPTPAPNLVTVSGSLIFNGFLPSGSYVNMYARRNGTTDQYQLVFEKIPARNGQTWTTDKAESGVTYDYQAELYTSSGTFIGESNYLTVTAPAANEIVTINSTAADPSKPTVATLKGTIKLNGPVTNGSTILLLQRKAGTADYTAINRYPAAASTNWEWKNAVPGTTYDITAALQVNEQNTASGNVQTVTAPADGVSITINTGVNLPAPTQTVSVSCGQPDGTNHYNATIGIPQNSSMNLYYLQVGTAAGSNNVYSDKLKPNQSATVYIAGNSPYFARYSQSTCSDCNVDDSTNWSGWSPTYGFICQPGQVMLYSQ